MLDIVGKIQHVVEGGAVQCADETTFNDLALQLFAYQYEANAIYRAYCRKRGAVPEDVARWEEIPAVPTDVFKDVAVTTFPPEEAVRVLKTSGTGDPSRRGKVYLNETGLRLLDTAYREAAKSYIYPDEAKYKGLLLVPPPQAAPDLGIAYGVWATVKDCLTDFEFLISQQGLDIQTLLPALHSAEETGEPVLMAGAPFAFVHFFDVCNASGIKFHLPPVSRLCVGGGFKGRGKEISRDIFLAQACEIFGLDPRHVIDVYALTEVSGAFNENALFNHVRNTDEARYKPNLPWTRTIAVNPNTLERVTKGEMGLLRHCALTNVCTAMAVQTDDLGFEIGSGFEIVGRAAGAEARGCSIATDDMLSTTRSGPNAPWGNQ